MTPRRGFSRRCPEQQGMWRHVEGSTEGQAPAAATVTVDLAGVWKELDASGHAYPQTAQAKGRRHASKAD